MHAVRLALGTLVLGFAPLAGAQEGPGRFEVRSASVELRSAVYYLDAAIDFELSSDAREALRSGLPLVIRIEIELIHVRRYWIDNENWDLTQRYRLEYNALSERYLLVNVNSGDDRSFGTLYAVLDYIGRIRGLPLIDAALLEPGRVYDIRVRAVLDTEQLPGPLRLLAFWRRDWSIASDWLRWRLQRD